MENSIDPAPNDPTALLERTVAVLTGDIVRSSRLSGESRASLHGAVAETSQEIQGRFGGAVPYEVDMFRGDSWQMLVIPPRLALRIALFFRSFLRSRFENIKVDTRIAIGVGGVDFLPEKGVSTGDGEAFQRSGWAFEDLGRSYRMAFSSDLLHDRCLDVTVRLVDYPASHWTARQAYAVSQSLLDKTQEEIADAWMDRPVTQQAVAQHLARAGWHAVDTAVTFFEETVGASVP